MSASLESGRQHGALRRACTAAALAIISTAATATSSAVSPSEQTPRMLSGAELRQLNNNNNNNNNNNEKNNNDDKNNQAQKEDDAQGFYADLTPYSMRLERCQYVKQFDDSIVDNYYSAPSSMLTLQQLVVFRLCPKDSCSSGCDSEYGEYVTSMYDYLYYLTDMNANRMDSLCNACTNYCWDDAVQNFSHQGNSVTCDGCKNKCNSYQNSHAYGYVDAANYIKCTAVYKQTKHSYTNNYGYTDSYSTTKTYYVGPKCVSENKYKSSSSRGNRHIRIGVFSDSNCSEPMSNTHVEDVLGYKVNYHKFRISDSGDQECLACQSITNQNNKNKNKNNNNNNKDGSKDEEEEEGDNTDSTLAFCYSLYGSAAKCEAKHGFQAGYAQVNGFDTQISNEASTCTYVDSLVYDSYNAYGEINTLEEQDVYDQYITHDQKMAILILTAGVVGLVLYGNFLHAEIKDGYPTLRLHLLATGEADAQEPGGIFT